MPAVSRTHRAEARFNVTLDFPNLGLHSAAASGNLGLVTYALDHNQPVNSVLDGVLPLHVASSGGNDQIVRLLIERGADVNAPRLPRKYSSDRHKDASAPIVGSSGATPLHFAAANGHEQVVLTLLLHGAHPSRADKHGTTPAMLARQQGWTRVADLLTKWTDEKDRDLRERDALSPPPPEFERTMSRMESLECRAFEKRVKVKRSIDNAINILRPAPSLGQLQPDASYTTSPPPIAGSSSVDHSPDTGTMEEFPPRRPSLPHIFESAPGTRAPQSATYHHPSKSSGRPSCSSSRRPRSAGTDAEPVSTSSTPGRLRGKISLLHMFKKASGDTNSGPATPEGRDPLSGYASSSSAVTSASASPAPERERGRNSSTHSPLRTRASETGTLSSASGSSYPAALATAPSTRSRLGNQSEINADASFPPMAVELHRRLSRERVRTRSGSGSGSSTGEPPSKGQSPSPRPPPLSQLQGHRSPPVRPGILRPHNRSASSGQSQLQPPVLPGEGSARSLRFESSSTSGSLTTKRSGLTHDLNASGSVNSLRGEPISDSPRSPRSASSHQRLRDPDSPEIPARRRQAVVVDDEDEEGYGEVISPRIGLGLGLTESKSRLDELKSEERQLQHQPSFSSQLSPGSSSADSQLPSPTEPSQDGFDCPFSINRPPIQPLPPDAGNTSSSLYLQPQSPPPPESRANLLVIHGVDNRGRGDSFGSMSTSTDASMPQTPAAGPGLGLDFRSPDTSLLDLPDADVDHDKPRSRADSSASGGSLFSQRDRGYHSRSRTMSPNSRLRAPPLDIDIRAISSHAQAEALVQRAQKSILDEEDVDIELPGLGLITGSASSGDGLAAANNGLSAGAMGPGNASTVTLGNGRTPLSAKLAAYGESLAIERRFKQQERAKESMDAGSRPMDSAGIDESYFGSAATPRRALRPMHSESGVRKFSLEERERPAHGVHTSAPRKTKQKRPHTADGETSDHSGKFLAPVQRPLSPGHQHSLSGSAIVGSRPSPSPEKNTFLRPPTSSRTVPLMSPPSSSTLAPRIVRSRTPDPDMDTPSPSTSASGTFGVPLSRVSTAPPRHASPDIATHRSISEQERERVRANKLTKMGLPTTGDAFPRAHSPYGHARNGGGSAGSSRQRFGGFRGFVQTLTGKTQ